MGPRSAEFIRVSAACVCTCGAEGVSGAVVLTVARYTRGRCTRLTCTSQRWLGRRLPAGTSDSEIPALSEPSA